MWQCSIIIAHKRNFSKLLANTILDSMSKPIPLYILSISVIFYGVFFLGHGVNYCFNTNLYSPDEGSLVYLSSTALVLLHCYYFPQVILASLNAHHSMTYLLSGADWVNPEDPNVIAENELLGAAAAIEAAARKLAELKPKPRPKVQQSLLIFFCNVKDPSSFFECSQYWFG